VLDTRYLDNVIAISNGDSFDISMPLLCEPATYLEPSHIRRAIGNIGRSGLAMLIPVKNPEIKEDEI
jgi:hypothetical protein